MKGKWIDLHCHILPGLDDGPRTLEESLALSRSLVEDGIGMVVATPHMCNGIYAPTRATILEKVKDLQQHHHQEKIVLDVLPGAEIHLTHDLDQLLKAHTVLTIGDQGKYCFLELPDNIWPPHLNELVFRIQLMGILPILTHPERISVVQQEIALLRPLVESNVLMQLTAASIVGDFGAAAQTCARTLLEAKMAHIVATDAHSVCGRPPRLSKAKEYLQQWLGEETTTLILEERPAAIVRGDYIAIDSPALPPQTRKFRWRW